jgi:hypothetical protein
MRFLTWSNCAKTSELGWWMDATMVQPVFAMSLRTWQTSAAIFESRPEVGSSRKTTDGKEMSSTAMDRRLRSSA